MYVVDPSVIVTSSFPRGCISVRFTAWGVMVDISRLSLCSPRRVKVASPAKDRLAPESGNTSISVLLFKDEICTQIVGADLIASGFPSLIVVIRGVCPSVGAAANIAFVAGWASMWGVGGCGCLLLQTLAR